MDTFKFIDYYHIEDEIYKFLCLYGDGIYLNCKLKKVLNFEEDESQSQLFFTLDKNLNKITSKFEIELFLEQCPELVQFYSLKYKNSKKKKNVPKNNLLHIKLQNYFFGYQPSIHYLFTYKTDLQLKVEKYTEIQAPKIAHLTKPFIKKRLNTPFNLKKAHKTFQMYQNNTIIQVVDPSDQTKRFDPLLFGSEFLFLLDYFKK